MTSSAGSRLAVFGAGGFGREVAGMLRTLVPLQDLVFVTDAPSQAGATINGLRLLDFDDLCGPDDCDRDVVIAVADASGRRRISERCLERGLGLGTVQASTHRAYDDVVVGVGAVLCDFTMITGNVRIGRHFHCNLFSYVAHDCQIGDFVTFAPRVSCNGRVVIEDDVYVGTGATIRPGDPDRPLRLGRGATIGMGAVVTKDVPAGAVVVGNPARSIASGSDG